MEKYFFLLVRLFTSIFSIGVDKNRKGYCKQCGDCCNLAYRCPLLNKKNECRIYSWRIFGHEVRPWICCSFPNNKWELEKSRVTRCGYYFKEKEGKKPIAT